MNEWLETLKEFDKSGKVEKCPFCKAGSGAVKVDVREEKGEGVTIFMECRECGRGVHFN